MDKHIGNYKVVAELGRGGMGVVYKAHEESLQRFVAIKMLGNQLVDNESVALRFMREARAVADLNHPNLVQVFRVDRHEDQPYFVMEYVEGESLKHLIQRERKMQPLRALQILKEVAAGLAAAHAKGVVHRDIKPENIMLTKYGGVKVVDFGIARVDEPGTRLTTTGIGLGTPSYLSPEVCLSQDVDQRSDIFSLGVVLFEMLTGDTPFKSESPFELMTKVVEARIPEIKELNPNVDDGVRQILAKMIAKRPKQRYQNCDELIDDIEDYRTGRVPRRAGRTPLATEPAQADHTTDPSEDTEGPAVVDESTQQATTPMPIGDAATGKTADPAPAPTLALESEADRGHRRGLALAAVFLLLIASGAVAGSWYLLSGPDRPLLAMFGSASDEVNENAASEPIADGAVAADESSPSGDMLVPAADQTEVRESFAETGDAGSDSDSSVEEVPTEAGGSDRNVAMPPDNAVADGAVAADEPSPSGDVLVPAADQTEVRESFAETGDAGSDSDSSVEEVPTEAGGSDRNVAMPPDNAVADAFETVVDADTGLDEAMARVGESSGEALVSVATPGAPTRLAESRGAMPANLSVAVVAVGDPAVTGTVAREIKRALNGASFEIIDEQLIDGLVYAESLAGVVRSVRDAGASVLVYADVVPAGERELQFYGRRENQYMASLEVRVVDVHAQRNLGPVMAEKLEYVPLTADRQAFEAADPLARKVVDRLRELRSSSGQGS